MRVGTPLGEYPFEFRRLERRDGGLAIVGIVAGLESTVLLSPGELARIAGVLAVPATATAVLAALWARRSLGSLS